MLAPWILEHFPAHDVYTEAFGGAASVLFRKPRARLVEVYNDADGEIVNVFRVLRDRRTAEDLAAALRLTPFARVEFEESYVTAADPVEQARRTIARALQGFGSDSASGATTGFRANGQRQNTHPARDWVNYPRNIPDFCDRLQGVVVEHREALDIIRQHDGAATLHYCDPPYTHGSRSKHTVRTSKGYRHEMTDEDHRALGEVLRGAAGMVVVSGYPSELYEDLYRGWRREERRALADGGGERTEILWINEACSTALEAGRAQPRLIA